MKKLLVMIILLSCISTFSYSQSKTEFGLTTEGSWFMPSEIISYFRAPQKDGFGAGIGVYASRNLFWRVSADIGLAFRYKQMQQHYIVYYANSSGYDPYGSTIIEGWDKLPMHYIVVPLHLQMILSKSFFVRGGIESTWLTNYKIVNEKPEFNWTLGFGSQKHKLKWSVNYIKGFKEQSFGNITTEAIGRYKGSSNRNNMLQISLSYPIWQKK